MLSIFINNEAKKLLFDILQMVFWIFRRWEQALYEEQHHSCI